MKADDIKRAERARQRGNTSRQSGNENDAAVPEPFEIDNDTNENENYSDNDNRKDDLFSNDSNDDPDKGGFRDPDYAQGNGPDDNDPGDDSDPDDNYTQSTGDEQTKKKKSSKRKTPTSAIRVPINAHWACLKTPEEGEAANVLVAIGTEYTIAKFIRTLLRCTQRILKDTYTVPIS